MGYTTDFEGRIDLSRELTASEAATLVAFNDERHEPAYTAENPSYYCQWVPTKDGRGIEWDGGEKFYSSPEWMQVIVDRFLKPWGIVANGVINAEGESQGDVWRLKVENNAVSVVKAKIVWEDA